MIVYEFSKYAARQKHRPVVRFIESRKSLYLTLDENLGPAARESIVDKMHAVKGVFYAASTGDPENNVRVLLDDAHNGPAAKAAAEKLPGVAKAEYGQVPTIAAPQAQTKIAQVETPRKNSWRFW